jgi:hypothetical protein
MNNVSSDRKLKISPVISDSLDPKDSFDLVNMLIRHEERIQDIESGMDKITLMAKDSNHQLANMRISLKMLKPITESVQEIEKLCEINSKIIAKHEKAFEMQKVHTDTTIEYMTKQIESIGPWIKWGVGFLVSAMTVFFGVMASLKILS